MLRGLRTASSGWLGKSVMAVVVGFLIVSFAIWGIGDIFKGFGRPAVAKLGKTEVTIEQFRQLFNDRLQQIGRQVGRPLTAEQARAFGIDQQLLGTILAEAALDERARQLRLGISDSELARRIAEEPAFRGVNGQFDRGQFERVIRNAGYTEQRYVQEQRKISLRRQIATAVGGDVKPAAAMTDALARYDNETRAADYVRLDAAQAGDIPAPAADALAKYFDERKVQFRAPEYRKLTVLSLTPDAIGALMEVGADEIKAAYERNLARFSKPEKRQLSQMMFPSADEAKKAAERIAGGLSFAELAKERGVPEKDIDLGLVQKSEIADKAVADAAFALKEGGTSGAIEGRFGASIVHVGKIEPGHTPALAEIEAEIKRDLAAERARAEIGKMRDKIEDEVVAGARLEEAAKKLNLQYKSIAAVDRSGRGPDGQPVADLPKGGDILTPAFASEVGVENDPVQVPGGGFIWFDVMSVSPSRERTLDEVKDRVEAAWREEQVRAKLDAKAAEMVDKLKAGGSLADIASAAKLKLETAKGVKRRGGADGLSADAVAAVFRTAKGAAGKAEGREATERVVFRVTEIEVPAFDANSEDGKRIADALRTALSDDLVSQYIARIESDLGVTINQSALAQATGASTAN